jgi:ferric-dicitrate binding protein FerR (iron transport regulator)
VSAVEVTRQEWYEGTRRLESLRDDPHRHARALEQLELVLDELRKRVGQTYTLAELAAAYAQAERWARELLEERATVAGWARDLAVVLAAAFHAYARGALDYEP